MSGVFIRLKPFQRRNEENWFFWAHLFEENIQLAGITKDAQIILRFASTFEVDEVALNVDSPLSACGPQGIQATTNIDTLVATLVDLVKTMGKGISQAGLV